MGMHTHILHRLSWTSLAATVAFVLPVTVLAQPATIGTLPIGETYQTISSYALLIGQFFNILTWIVFSFLVFLIDPRFIFDMANGSEGSLMDVLNTVWQLSRNVMNIAFAVGLVGAAIYTVVTANKEFVSANLRTFVMAVVLVNFSWFIPRVAIDIANVATATIYSIPTAVVNANADCRYVNTNRNMCFDPKTLPDGTVSCACKAVADFKPFPESKVITALSGDPKDPAAWHCSWLYCIRYVKLDVNTSTQHGGVLNGLIVNHARLPQLAVITRTDHEDGIADFLLFILREMVVIVIQIALFFPLLALLVALVIRIPILWLTMAFMPFYFLSWVIPDELPLGSVKEYADKIWSTFIKAAFLPAAVAIPLSIGFIMANAGSHVKFTGMNDIPFNLIDGMGSFGQLLWVVMVLGILWSGTFMVLEMMTADMPGAELVGTIKATGEEAGKFAAEMPLANIPLPGGNVLKYAQMLSPRGISAARAAQAGTGGTGAALTGDHSDADKISGRASRMTPAESDAFVRRVKDFKDVASLNEAVIKKTFQGFFDGTDIILNDRNFPDHVATMIDKLGKFTDSERQAFRDQAKAYQDRNKITPSTGT